MWLLLVYVHAVLVEVTCQGFPLKLAELAQTSPEK
jgi:hypothetical protein